MAILVHMHQQVIQTGPVHHLLLLPASDALRRAIPKNNFPLAVGDVGAIRKQVQRLDRVKLGQQGGCFKVFHGRHQNALPIII
jgi:hypothetical protein